MDGSARVEELHRTVQTRQASATYHANRRARAHHRKARPTGTVLPTTLQRYNAILGIRRTDGDLYVLQLKLALERHAFKHIVRSLESGSSRPPHYYHLHRHCFGTIGQGQSTPPLPQLSKMTSSSAYCSSRLRPSCAPSKPSWTRTPPRQITMAGAAGGVVAPILAPVPISRPAPPKTPWAAKLSRSRVTAPAWA